MEFADAVVKAAVASIQKAQLLETAKADNARLEALAHTDPLTQVLNRRALFERLEHELLRARRAKSPVSVVLYDLDHFKALNDGHGHPAGDAALRSFARILERNVRASDAVGRVGGDEFALILAGADAADVARILERITSTLETDPPSLGEVSASYGVARTAYGVIGIKVWIFKGEIMEHDPMAAEKRAADLQESGGGGRPRRDRDRGPDREAEKPAEQA